MVMSARMISLSINIALMGLILSSSVSGYVLEALPKAPSDAMLGIISDLIFGRKPSHHRKPRRVRRAGARGASAWHRQGHSLRCDVCDDPGLGFTIFEIAARPLKASGPVQSPPPIPIIRARLVTSSTWSSLSMWRQTRFLSRDHR